MPVEELMQHLSSIKELLEAGNEVLNSSRSDVKLRVVATERNSFAVTFLLDVGFWDAALDFMQGREATAVVNLLELVTGGVMAAAGIYKLVAWLRGRPVGTINFEGKTATVRTESGDELVVSASAAKAIHDKRVRDAAIAGLVPLASEGYTKLQIYQGDDTGLAAVLDEITHTDVLDMIESSEAPPSPSEVTQERMKVQIVRPSFVPDLQWTFSDGSGRFSCEVTDPGFLKRASGGEEFKAGDFLEVTIQREVGVKDGKLRAKVTIPEVHRHVRAATPGDLFGGQPGHE